MFVGPRSSTHRSVVLGAGLTPDKACVNLESAEAQSSEVTKTKPGNKVIRKGWMSLQNITLLRGGSKDFWFVLNTESLTWYKDDEEKEKRYVLLLDGLKLRDIETGFFGKKNLFALYYPDNRNVYKDYKQLELCAESSDSVDSWKASFLRAGVHPVKTKIEHLEDADNMSLEGADPQLERQVEIIRNLVDSYMKIVVKTQLDLVPKLLMHMLVNEIKTFLKGELLPNLYQAGDLNTLMSESLVVQQKRDEMVRVYDAMKEALSILSEVTMSTVSTPTPPPVKDDWLQVEHSGGNNAPPHSPSANRRAPPPPPGGSAKMSAPSRPVSTSSGKSAPAPMPSPLIPQRIYPDSFSAANRPDVNANSASFYPNALSSHPTNQVYNSSHQVRPAIPARR